MPNRYVPWTTKERQFVRDHYGPLARHPWPTAQIAAALGRQQEDIRSAARRYGCQWRERVKVPHRQALDLYGKGMADGQIARRIGCDRRSIWRWRKLRGLPRVGKGGQGWKYEQLRLKAAQLRQEGLTLSAISQRLGVHLGTVWRWVRGISRQR